MYSKYLNQLVLFQFLIGRLETQKTLTGVIVYHQFQFLIGRLETGADQLSAGRVSPFQFLIGRLETVSLPGQGCLRILVSIPHR